MAKKTRKSQEDIAERGYETSRARNKDIGSGRAKARKRATNIDGTG